MRNSWGAVAEHGLLSFTFEPYVRENGTFGVFSIFLNMFGTTRKVMNIQAQNSWNFSNIFIFKGDMGILKMVFMKKILPFLQKSLF